MGSEPHLEDVWANLLLNARDATAGREDSVITITTGLTGDGKAIEVITRDNGTGISPQHVESIFEPLFTTKRQGTGLGLSICYDVVTRHGGTMRVMVERCASPVKWAKGRPLR
jgi:C4-dicarboxylate-specific signal transduction histidine kinase